MSNAAGGLLDLCVPALEIHYQNTSGQADTVPALSPPKQEELYGRLEEDKEAKVFLCLSAEIPCKTDCVSGMRAQARSSELTEAVRATSEIPESEDVPVSASTSLMDQGLDHSYPSNERVQWRKEQLVEIMDLGAEPQSEKLSGLSELLQEYHHAFALEADERGETDLVQFSIDTGEASPMRQPSRRSPFAARAEVSRQIATMMRTGIIRPSQCPWASPVVLVRKKDGSLKFCIDYRSLNSVTKPDLFPLPRIEDLLHKVGKSR